MSLRESIEKIIIDLIKGVYDKKYPDEVADEVISFFNSQPSELVAVRECHWNDPKAGWDKHGENCPTCHGTGRIERILTQKEALEFLKTSVAKADEEGYVTLLMPTGEQIERR